MKFPSPYGWSCGPQRSARCSVTEPVGGGSAFLTPVDAGHTRYFWFQMRNVFPDDPAISRLMADGVRGAFEEDRVILNTVQQGFANTRTAHIDIAIDSAPLRFRRRLRQLIEGQRPLDPRQGSPG
jgi:hypothetical protein